MHKETAEDMRGTAESQSPLEIQRFGQALRQAMAINNLSERRLAHSLGITIGTTQKYFRGAVHPLKVATGITHKLAGLLGISTDALVHFYSSGVYESELTLEQIVAWLRTHAGQSGQGVVVSAFAGTGQQPGGVPLIQETPRRYDWPKQELNDVGLSPSLRERMGLGDAVLERLATTGEFDDELVEAFSVAANYEEDAVREAFTQRKPVV